MEPASPVLPEPPDWSRERKRFLEWAPSKSLLASIRSYQRHAAHRSPWSLLVRHWAVLRHRFWSAVTAADVPLNCHIEGGLLMPHPASIVIHPDARIGPNCLIFQGVTLGTSHSSTVPTLEGHVDVGAGAKVLGGVRLGWYSKIGANAVVLTDVPAYATAVGVPAQVIVRREAKASRTA